MKTNFLVKLSLALFLCLGICVHIHAEEPIYHQKAQKIARDFFLQNANRGDRRGADAFNRTAVKSLWDSKALTTGDSSVQQMALSDEEPTFFVFANPQGKGFVIVSGDDVNRPVIGYSFENDAVAAHEIPANMMEYLRGIDEDIKEARLNGFRQPALVSEMNELVAGKDVVNLKTAAWGQRTPFNNQCPVIDGTHCLTGCVPTAFAIIFQYHQWPLVGKGVIGDNYGEQTDLSTHEYLWDKMPDQYVEGEYTKEEADAVALLMRDLGRLYQVIYGLSITGGNPSSGGLESLKEHFRYRDGVYYQKNMNVNNTSVPFTDDEWKAFIKADLDAHLPIAYAATRNRDVGGVDGKHIFVLDGYTDKGYYHFNWGWSGASNGYYTLDAMTPNADGSNYNANHKAHFRLTPDKKDAPEIFTIKVRSDGKGAAYIGDSQNVSEKRMAENSSITIHAVPKAGFSFANWTLDGKAVSTDADYSIVASRNAEYVANFRAEGDVDPNSWFYICFKASGNYLTANKAGGQATAEQKEENSPAQLWRLVEVENSNSARIKEYQVVNQHNIYLCIQSSVVKRTESASLYLAYNPGEQNFRKENWNGSGGLKGERLFYYGKENDFPISEVGQHKVELVRSNNEDNMVVSFEPATTNPLPVRYDLTYTVVPETAAERVSASVDGALVSSGAKVKAGSDVLFKFQIHADEHVRMQIGQSDSMIIETDTYLIRDIQENLHVTIEFVKKAPELVTIGVSCDEGGRVSIDRDHPSTRVEKQVEKNSKVRITALLEEGYVFVDWCLVRGTETIRVSTEPDYEFTASSDMEYVAHFKERETGLESVTSDIQLKVIDGSLFVYGFQGYMQLFKPTGECVWTDYIDGDCQIPVAPGLYLIRTGNEIRKVIVK